MERIGRYEIISELGRGAMGIVYKARDTKIGREVAIKTIRLVDQAAPSETTSLKERLFREAQSAGRLSHPGIVTIYDVSEESGLAYITMEFVDGRTLEKLMHVGQAGDTAFVADFLHQTAAALDYAHGKDIVHRDIKPANMMITPEGGVKITDFGIARITSSQLTQTGTVMGTPSYMSPEQVRGDAIDGRSDQFSLGVIAYELLTGQKPFVGESLTSVIFKIVSSEPVPPRQLRSDMSAELEAALLRSLAKDPDARYASCRELAAAIEVESGLLSAADNLEPGESEIEPTAKVVSPADLTAPAIQVGNDSGQYEKTMPIAAAKTAKLPPLASKAGTGAFRAGRLEDSTAGVGRRPKRRRAWLWATGALLLAAGGAAAWFVFSPQARIDESAFAGKLSPPNPAADVFSAQVKKLQEDGTITPMPVTVGFTSDPAGAKVVVDGEEEKACIAPCSMELLPGEHQVVASLGDYFDESRTLEVGVEPADLALSMRPLPPTIVRFNSKQRGTRIVVDGDSKLSCTTPCLLELRRGEHQARASAAHYNSAAKTFAVSGDAIDVAFDLKPLPPTKVEFSSDPAGSRVVVDRNPRWSCTTPCSLELPRGRREYLASQQGFRSIRKPIDVGGEPLNIKVELEKIVGTVLLSSNPTGADIYVDGRKHPEKTSARLSLSPGYHLIRVESGSRVSERSVAVRENDFRSMHFVLGAGGALKSTLVLKSDPPGASIVLNDTNQAGNTPREISLPPGSYRVTFSLQGYRPVIQEIELTPNESSDLNVSLSRQN